MLTSITKFWNNFSVDLFLGRFSIYDTIYMYIPFPWGSGLERINTVWLFRWDCINCDPGTPQKDGTDMKRDKWTPCFACENLTAVNRNFPWHIYLQRFLCFSQTLILNTFEIIWIIYIQDWFSGRGRFNFLNLCQSYCVMLQ